MYRFISSRPQVTPKKNPGDAGIERRRRDLGVRQFQQVGAQVVVRRGVRRALQ
jgi:hypothetical protein